jgi:predicted 3-demethylubiquinone-9 3-methyltransferase (glyoxalase superfamily)
MQKITPCLWFDGDAEEAATLYCSWFPNSKITRVTRYPEAPGLPAGKAMTVEFELAGQAYLGLNGGPQFKFTEAVSFMIYTEDQAETDRLWNAITADGGEESMCGWCKDRFGLSWQVTPRRLMEFTTHPDREKAGRAMQAMMGMRKIDIALIEAAAEG